MSTVFYTHKFDKVRHAHAMPRSIRNANLEHRTNRLKLERGRRHWQSMGDGLALGYWPGTSGTGGVWHMRRKIGKKQYHVKRIGPADDYRTADGEHVLRYSQALERARELGNKKAEPKKEQYTVRDAISDYLEWFAEAKRSIMKTRYVCNRHILPALGDRRLADLTTDELRRWHHDLAKVPRRQRGKELETPLTDPEAIRKRRATANRIMAILKAALNRAYDRQRCDDNRAWTPLKKFERVDSPPTAYLSVAECKRLVNAADPDFRKLIQGGLFTGCRYGELVTMEVRDFDARAATVLARITKSGRQRHLYLNAEGAAFFTQLTAGHAGGDPMFVRADGDPWRDSQQLRRMTIACECANIDPPCSFRAIRHTYGALLAAQGVPLKVIAESMGHADTRITEKHYAHLQESYVARTIRDNLPVFNILEPTNVSVLDSA